MDTTPAPEARDLEIPNYTAAHTSSILPDLPFKLPHRTPNPPPSAIYIPPQALDLPENPPHHLHPLTQPTPDSPPPETEPLAVRYKECLKNHAAAMGGHVVDGCGEFMPGGDEGTPEALRCAACDCHRNFHRKEVDGEPPQYSSHHHYAFQRPPPLLHAAAQPNHSAPPRHHHRQQQQQPTMFNFGSRGVAAESSSEDLNTFGGAGQSLSHSRKRFRTKFSQNQKDRMQELASRIGWRIQKQDEEEVQRFCADTGVKRQVFKVWMHNNKQANRRRSSHNSSNSIHPNPRQETN